MNRLLDRSMDHNGDRDLHTSEHHHGHDPSEHRGNVKPDGPGHAEPSHQDAKGMLPLKDPV
ncbi:hypothetical protein [Burkholderia pseudomultivorans]|uniref:hypothetical protein n=1 Tax=Burkholderia pseudomultivorans TaxID=1207504 RepID=UPI001890A2D7|nr:hypothetical protein [Burkholderia pseudomultivorans]MBF5008715.1 hypothetical protein [Burkholderia pseudomultivorans]